MAIAYHVHDYTIPTATDEDASNGVLDTVALTPANLPSILSTKQDASAALTSLAGLSTSADQIPYTTAENTYATTAITVAGRTLIGLDSASLIRAYLDLEPGVDIQTYDAGLASISGLTTAADQMLYTTGADTYAVTGLTAQGRALLDDADAATMQATLALVPGTDVQAWNVNLQGIADGTIPFGDMETTTYDPNGIGLDAFDAANTNVEAAWAGLPAIVRKVGAKLNADLPSSGDLGHDPAATASFNDGALQDAIDAIQAEANGGLLNIGRGTFTHSATINLPKVSGKRCILRGQGEATRLYFPATGAMNALYAGSLSAGGGLGWHLRDFRIQSDTDDFVTGIYLQNANSVTVEGVGFETLKECIVSDTSFGMRFIGNRALSIGGDFFRAATRTHGNIFDRNSYFTSLGYFANFEDVGSNINNAFTNNDSEVVLGVIKSTGPLYALTYNHNYMEQASGAIFDFGGPTYGTIIGNTLQMSPTNQIANFLGQFVGNHLFDQSFTWEVGTSYPTDVSGNILAGTSTLEGMPARTFQPTLEGSTSAGAGTYTSRVGSYTKIGNRVYFEIGIGWSAHTGTGNMRITGLPFPNNGNLSVCSVRANNLTYSADLVAYISAGASLVDLQGMASNAGLVQQAMDTSGTLWISGHYITNP